MMEPELSSPPADGRSRFAPVFDILNGAIAAHTFPGCAFGVFADGDVVLQDALGRFTYDDDARVVTATTVYDIASLTKVVAAAAASMLLYQKGLLDLDIPLGELLPGFVVGRSSNERAHHVRLRHLLAHNSGLPGYVELFRTETTPAALLRACLQLPLEAEPGTRAEYSDPGFILLGKALEVLTGQDLAAFVRNEVFQPFGLVATGFAPRPDARPFIPPTEEDTSFRHRRIQGEVEDENAWRLGGVAGHAGLFSNVPDLLSFASRILVARGSRGLVDRSDLFERKTIDCFAERQGPEGSSRALGWDTPSPESSAGRYFSPKSIGHLGFSGCSLWIDLESDIAVVLLTNRTWPDRQNQEIRSLRPAFHDAVRKALLPVNR